VVGIADTTSRRPSLASPHGSHRASPANSIISLGESKDEFIRQRALQVIGRIRPANTDKQKIIEEKKK